MAGAGTGYRGPLLPKHCSNYADAVPVHLPRLLLRSLHAPRAHRADAGAVLRGVSDGGVGFDPEPAERGPCAERPGAGGNGQGRDSGLKIR